MGIDAASSTTSSTVSSTAQVSSASNSDNAKKTSSDSSFKDEMSKVSEEKDVKTQDKIEKEQNIAQTNPDKQQKDEKKDDFQNLNGAIDYTKFAAMDLNNANTMLQNNIQEMMNTNNLQTGEINGLQAAGKMFSFEGLGEAKNQVSLTQDDAQFFINLTQENDVSNQNITALAQNMITNGADASEVTKNAKISQTLLNALSNARENNQPLRIDFDQNVSVILRIGQDGALSARFIPGDKAVEQYLRNNIESLKATFNENDLPYSDLSYSNSSKQQNERRRNKQQQGEQ